MTDQHALGTIAARRFLVIASSMDEGQTGSRSARLPPRVPS
jgi:hypothetical protein